ncbi:HBL194Cp [Eremothecium sinecaudum]|uniref:HBL194Cp n=1 Tax=Eremothecium sinecaudum TaxID=45286 RepID=A0A109UW69_9SACH|nr:HBL194Cp [Eremothecium sinecaudum]AMD18708.1 HBL194Cp [Eremothecium sinecaudum]
MPPPILRPENALKRADELISVNEPQAALQSLFDYFSSKRIRSADPAAIEPIVIKFLELGVQLKKGKDIKNGLYHYKKNVQSSAEGLNSVGSVSRKFIDLIETNMSKQEAKANREENTDEEDLEGGVTPENLLISVYEQDQSVGGFNDEAVTSWLRFTWESYRNVLDLLRNNSQLEITYSGAVNRAMQFCLKYNRKNEFKRLADMLRQHLDTANYYRAKFRQHTVDLSDADTLQRYLDQRILQVNVSVKLELWHEAFRSIEDVHHLLSISSRPPKPSVLANYYQNMAMVFSVSSNYLMNSIALEKFYKLYQNNPNATEEDFVLHASQFLLSALSIAQDDLPIIGFDPSLRLIGFLDLDHKPTRQEMIEAATEESVFSKVDPDVKELYHLLNSGFDIVTLKEKLTSLLPALVKKPYFARYVAPLKDFTIRKAFIDASKNFTVIKLDELFDYVNLPAPFDFSPLELEKALLQAAMDDYVSFSIDCEAQIVTFVHDPFEVLGYTGAPESERSPDDGEEETSAPLQEEEPEQIMTRNSDVRSQLIELAKLLREAEGFSQATYVDKIRLARTELLRKNKEIYAGEKALADERLRQIELERQSSSGVALTPEQVVEERQRRMKEEKEAAEARLEAEAQRRAEEKRERELAEINEMTMKKMIMDVNARGIIYIDPEEAKDMNLEKFKKLTVELVSKDKKDLDERMSNAFKKVDYTERAYRKLQLPVWEKDAKMQEDRDLKNYQNVKKMLLEKVKKEHEESVTLHNRLVNIYPSYLTYWDKLQRSRNSQLDTLRAENRAKLEEAKKARIEEVRRQRYEQMLANKKEELAAKEEETKKLQNEERLIREREERNRINRAKDEAARKQREIEEDIERRLNQKTASPAPAAKPEAKMTYWEKVKLKKQQGLK